MFVLRCAVLAILLALSLSSSGCGSSGPAPLRVAVTTSTQNSGLIDYLMPELEKELGTTLQILAVGTGKALRLGESGDVDVVIVHAREREDAFVQAGHAKGRHDLMWNDFLILGPPTDPAKVRGLKSAAAALAKIQASKAQFVSRGDDSGTHIREKRLWQSAISSLPEPSETYLSAGLSQGKCLTIASEKQAYLLSDRGTYLSYRSRLALEPMVEGDPVLRNEYGILAVNPERHPHVQSEKANQLIQFLLSEKGQKLIEEYQLNGEQLFHPIQD